MERRTSAEVMEELLPLQGQRRSSTSAVATAGWCGSLTRKGAHVTGIEVSPKHLAHARVDRPGRRRALHARASPRICRSPPRSADIVIFFNSLHHVDEAGLFKALREAARVLKPGGILFVSEPLAEGAYFETMKPVHDETQVRNHAQEALRYGPEFGLLLEKTFDLHRHGQAAGLPGVPRPADDDQSRTSATASTRRKRSCARCSRPRPQDRGRLAVRPADAPPPDAPELAAPCQGAARRPLAPWGGIDSECRKNEPPLTRGLYALSLQLLKAAIWLRQAGLTSDAMFVCACLNGLGTLLRAHPHAIGRAARHPCIFTHHELARIVLLPRQTADFIHFRSIRCAASLRNNSFILRIDILQWTRRIILPESCRQK